MNIKNDLIKKLEGLLLENTGKTEVYNWALNITIKNQDRPHNREDEALFRNIFIDLLELNEPEWLDLTPQKIQYFVDCLSNKEQFSEEKARTFNKRNI